MNTATRPGGPTRPDTPGRMTTLAGMTTFARPTTLASLASLARRSTEMPTSPDPGGPESAGVAGIADAVRAELTDVMRFAHVNTFHPNAFDWSEAATPAELEYLSVVAFGEPGHGAKAAAYIAKELAQLAEIERHVSAVMALAMGELHDLPDAVNHGHELHHALSCFAAEEFQHANTFYRYARAVSGIEPRVANGLFEERLAVFRTDDHPYVKLVALCLSAYVGESVITVFEHRTDALDPDRTRFFTRLLHAHGLDEARHVKVDHVAMKLIHPALGESDRERVRALLAEIEDLNRRLAQSFESAVSAALDLDFTTGNPAAETQLAMAKGFGAELFAEDGTLRTVDEILGGDLLDGGLRELVTRFSGTDRIHTTARLTGALR
ncbi:hypothetical protein [Kitasatospora sp. MAP5-34]|uniref:hypothetical protein n=1 Tax=Kitasatospora sp. MAP5-34 TaxID=3035102 RepID=UPI0024741F79|nr:hypothetical protein [Kitasatospora sp. MAP5-34]MDH6579070.1 hypothetical protein [Kitasatospora sp. MAP5-34]